jgi:hypothetical protein
MTSFQTLIESAPHLIKRKLEQLKFLRERPDYHPEKSCFEHIKIVTERLIQTEDPNLILAGVLHDICKLDTVKENPKTGWPTSPGHDKEAHDLIVSDSSGDIQNWITENGGSVTKVANICLSHMRFHQLREMRESKRENQIKLWEEQEIFESLKIFGAADNMLEEFNLDNLEKSWKTLRKERD